MGAIQKPSEYVYRHKSLGKNRNERFGVYFLFFGRYRETLQYKKAQRKKKRKKGYPQLISRVSFSIPSHPSRLVSRPASFPVPPVLFSDLFRSPTCSVLRPSRSPSRFFPNLSDFCLPPFPRGLYFRVICEREEKSTKMFKKGGTFFAIYIDFL